MSSSLALRKISGIAFLSSSFFLILGLVISLSWLSSNADLFIFNITLLILLLSAGVISLLSRLKAPLFILLGIYIVLSIIYSIYVVIKFGYLEEGLANSLRTVSQFFLPTGYMFTGLSSAIAYDLSVLSALAGAVLIIVSFTLSTDESRDTLEKGN
jgi:hypothetical protein